MKMKPINQWSLRVRITAYAILLTITLLAISMLFSYFMFHRQLKNTIAEHQYAEVTEIAEQLDDRLRLAKQQLEYMARNITPNDLKNPDRIQKMLDGEEFARAFFDGGLLVVNAKQRLVAESPQYGARRGTDYSNRDFVKQTLVKEKGVISKPYRTFIPPNDPHIAFTAPIKTADGQVIALLAGRHNLMKGSFLQSIADATIKGTGYMYIFAEDRTIVVHPKRNRIMEVVSYGKNKGIDRAIQDRFEGSMEVKNSTGMDGVVSFRRLKQTDWVLAGFVPQHEVYAPLRKTELAIVLSSAFVAVTAGLLVWLVIGRLTAPLQLVINHIKGMAGKQGEQRLMPEQLYGELGQLSRVFNTLVQEFDDQQEAIRLTQETYRIVAEFTAEVAFWRQPDNSVMFISPNCLELTGYSEGEFYARPELLDRLIHAEYQQLWQNHTHQHEEQPGQLASLELQLVTKNGQIRWVTHLCHQVYNEQGELLGVRGNFTDITALKQMQLELEEKRSFTERLLDKTAIPIFVIDSDHRIIVWNSAMEELSGLPAKEMLGTRQQWKPFYSQQRPVLADLVISGDPDELRSFYSQFRDSLHVELGVQSEGWFTMGDGKQYYLCFDAAPVQDKNGNTIAAIETLLDLTERKLAEDKERKLSRAVDENPCSIVITNRDGKIEYVNKKFCELTGYSWSEAIGQTPNILKSGDTAPEEYADMWRTISSGNTWHGEFHNRKKDGTLYWELASISPVMDKEGNITNFLAVKEDITERKQQEEELSNSREELQAKHDQLSEIFLLVDQAKQEWEDTLDCISDLVLMCDRWGKIRRCNRPASALAKLPYDKIIGQNWMDLFSDIKLHFRDFNGEHGHLTDDTGERHFELSVFPLKQQGNNEEKGCVVNLHDTTKLLKMSEDLERTSGELHQAQMQVFQQEKMASVGQLAAGVAHEINNPMGFISSNLSTLGKYMDKINSFESSVSETVREIGNLGADEKIAELRKKMKIDYILDDTKNLLAESLDGAERVRRIVQDLKSFSRVDEAESKPASINECIDSTLNILRNEIKYVADVKLDYGDLPMLPCHPQQLNQVFMNIIANAAHSIEGHGEISIQTRLEENSIMIRISDNGKGIKQEHLAKIFEPFFTTKEVGKGTGLGLSISYDIVRKHGGELMVESEEGKGSKFTIRLPLTAPASPAAEPDRGNHG
jgi:two-component system NtrC family sensor kinase